MENSQLVLIVIGAVFFLFVLAILTGKKTDTGTEPDIGQLVAELSADNRLRIESLIRSKQKIEAIKVMRLSGPNIGLKTAKDCVEFIEAQSKHF